MHPTTPCRPEVAAAGKRALGMRYKLLPYLYTATHAAAESGAPIMRPLWFNFPQDRNTHLIDRQASRCSAAAPRTAWRQHVRRHSIFGGGCMLPRVARRPCAMRLRPCPGNRRGDNACATPSFPPLLPQAVHGGGRAAGQPCAGAGSWERGSLLPARHLALALGGWPSHRCGVGLPLLKGLCWAFVWTRRGFSC